MENCEIISCIENDINEKQTKSLPILYNVKEISKILKTNTDYVYSLIKSKLIPVLKIGSYKVRPEALREFLIKYEGYDLTDPFNIVKLD